ncbi:zinc ABC transporter permease AztB [Leucobacter sp. 1207-22]|uniref:zinc ABC transporter permease AztB n=1 Tax=Leucobacter sp. 1207-22 TaxID=2604456 RepID=UPI004063E8E9
MHPFTATFVLQAIAGGVLVSAISALVGVWVIVRGMAFLGEAMSHGMLPGVAIASVLGGNVVIGAMVSAFAMALGVNALRKTQSFGQDTGIGLAFVGMLSLGVIVVSHSKSFATDLTAFLFGDVLAITPADLSMLAVALVVVAAVALLLHRSFVALSFDPRKAQTLGIRPGVTNIAMLVTLTVTISVSFNVVGTLLSFGMLIAPSATALLLVRRIPVVMLCAFVLGSLATVIGVLASWYLGTAAGASIALAAVAQFFVVGSLRWLRIHRATE